MPLRIGFDMDGVLADLSLAFQEVETRLFGPGCASLAGEAGRKEEEQERLALRADGRKTGKVPAAGDAETAPPGWPGAVTINREARRRRDLVWASINSTPNFWLTLQPVDPTAVRRIQELTLRHKWEVFFITQRPGSDGETVQRQTQLWLVAQGFDLPSVLVLGGSRGAAAAALGLNYHVDDSAQNCLDVMAASRAKPILIVPDNDEGTVSSARKLGIGTAPSIGASLDILDEATRAHVSPGLLARIAAAVGWKA
jgi:hypothetical protein